MNPEVFNEDLLDGLLVTNEGDIEEVREKFRNFWSGTSHDVSELYLDYIKIEQLPNKYFTDLRIINNLQKLTLSNNGLRSLPKEIGNLHNLQELNLSSNELASLPSKI